MSAQRIDRLLGVLAVLLALICAVLGAVLLRQEPEQEPESEAAFFTETAALTTVTTTHETTASAAESTTAASSAAETTATAPEETVPPADDAGLYAQYLQETLIPKYGLAADGAAEPAEQTGIAGAYFCDFLDRGADLLVIRLDPLDGSSAAVPVLLWYTLYEGRVVLADSFESKLPLSGYCLRYADKTLYLSGENLDEAYSPESRRCTEIAVQMQENRDMILLDMEQGSAADAPEPLWPEDAELLLEMRPDPANTAGRHYLLYDYTFLSAPQAIRNVLSGLAGAQP